MCSPSVNTIIKITANIHKRQVIQENTAIKVPFKIFIIVSIYLLHYALAIAHIGRGCFEDMSPTHFHSLLTLWKSGVFVVR